MQRLVAHPSTLLILPLASGITHHECVSEKPPFSFAWARTMSRFFIPRTLAGPLNSTSTAPTYRPFDAPHPHAFHSMLNDLIS